MDDSTNIPALLKRIEELEKENAMLRRDFSALPKGNSVTVPEPFKPLFDLAQQTVNEYFRQLKMDPGKGTIEINDQRYVLVRASALSKDFLDTIQSLYADRGEHEAMAIGKNFLFDIAHVIGMNDARNFHVKMNLTDPISKLSAGPIHFAYSGWAYVEILPESNPTPDENFYLIYNHPYSFEADSWTRSGKKSDTPICIMNAGYSSGWCEESFGIPLTAAEVTCTARGDEHCTFIMSPPHKIQEHLGRYNKDHQNKYTEKEQYSIPTFFERKKVEEEMQRSKLLAEESAKSKSDFVANMSHELRTPLGIILGFTDLVKKTALSPQQKEYLDAISSSGNSLLSIINDILDLSKLDAGKFIIESIPFNIADLLHSVQVMFLSKAKKKNLELTCTVDEEVNSYLSGDPMRLTQILINLIGNAIKFTEKGGVYVSCVVESKQENDLVLKFSIRDTGIGIAADKTTSIFDRFTQADSNITRRYGGTGLGLAITKQLIELQGGNIILKSQDGSGAEFIFTLPYTILDGQHAAIINQEMPETLSFGSFEKILVVDDNLFNQKLASNILQNNGFMVTVAENGSKALDILKTESFDIILMDIQMPVMDGYRATQLIREEMHITTPVIAMTAHALAGEKEKCMHAGMNDYLSKPFKEKDLLLKIARWNNDQPATNPEENKIIDLSFLFSQTRDNRSFVMEMITLFKQQNPKETAELKEAIDKIDYPGIYRIAHSIRNTTGFFGIDKLIGSDLLAIEKLAKSGNGIEEIKKLFAIVEQVCRKAVDELEMMDSSLLL
jgi:signal transduction histidine kinase/DNA-binding NarL/FixJ family response regulator/predicted hydrocarbon binding protein